PFIYGTLLSSLVALVIAVPLSVGVAVFTTEMCPKAFRGPLSFFVELLAAIPSVIYGLWAMFVLVPLLSTEVEPFRQDAGVDGTVQRCSVRNRHAGGGNHPGDHDHPHHFVDYARSAAGGTATAEGRRAGAWGHALGDDSRRCFTQRARRNSWRNHSRTGPGARGDHGRDHGDRKSPRNRQVAVRSRIHHGQRVGQ